MTNPGTEPPEARRSRLPWPACAVLVLAASGLLWWALARALAWMFR